MNDDLFFVFFAEKNVVAQFLSVVQVSTSHQMKPLKRPLIQFLRGGRAFSLMCSTVWRGRVGGFAPVVLLFARQKKPKLIYIMLCWWPGEASRQAAHVSTDYSFSDITALLDVDIYIS